MPQLVSGRHVAVGKIPLLERIKVGTDVEVYALIVAYRMTVSNADDLKLLLPVVYFDLEKGQPPNAPTFESGFSAKDVLDGKAGWTAEEIAEFRAWLDSDENVNAWVTQTFDDINDAIRNSLIWSSELVTDEPERTPGH